MTYADRQSGFIPDNIRLLEKYQLKHIVYDFIENSTFPSKYHWKRLIKSKIHENVVLAWNNRTLLPDFSRFRSLQPEYGPHWIWNSSKANCKLLSPCTSVLQMISNLAEFHYGNNICRHCDINHNSIVGHCIRDCRFLNLWQNILDINFAPYEFLSNQDKSLVSNILLGMKNDVFLSKSCKTSMNNSHFVVFSTSTKCGADTECWTEYILFSICLFLYVYCFYIHIYLYVACAHIQVYRMLWGITWSGLRHTYIVGILRLTAHH